MLPARASVALPFVALLAVASAAPAQTVSGRLVEPGRDGSAVGAARVQLLVAGQPRAEVTTDPEGRFFFRVPAAGMYQLSADRLGYRASVTPPVSVGPMDSLLLEFRIHPEEVVLEPLRVRADSRRIHPDHLAFYTRARVRSAGRYLTRVQIDSLNARRTTDLLRSLPGIVVTMNNRGRQTVQGRGGCHPVVFVDGYEIRDLAPLTVDEIVIPVDLEGIEVYPGAAGIPGEFIRRGDGCGVIAFWTRVGNN